MSGHAFGLKLVAQCSLDLNFFNNPLSYRYEKFSQLAFPIIINEGNYMNQTSRFSFVFPPMLFGFGIIMLLTIVMSGCRDNTITDSGTNITSTDDAAESIAASLASPNGGVMDQVGDVLDVPSIAGIGKTNASSISPSDVTKQYDDATGWWTVTVARQKTMMHHTAEIHRVYQYQFLNKDNHFQKFWLTGIDTAHSIHFKIINGTGNFTSPHHLHRLNSVSADWLATNTNTPIVTLNTVNDGAYTCSGSDTLSKNGRVRTLNYTLSMVFHDVTGPRGHRLDLEDKTGGTITGTYIATVTFTSGTGYSERNINQSFTLTLGGGNADLHIGGRHFHPNMRTGDLNP